MRYLLLWVLSFPAFATTWHVNFHSQDPGRLLVGSFTTEGADILRWDITGTDGRVGEPDFGWRVMSDSGRCSEGVCDTAAFTTPEHLTFLHLAGAGSTVTLDILMDGPLSEGVHASAELLANYGEYDFKGSGVLAAPEPRLVTILGTILACLLIPRALGRSRG